MKFIDENPQNFTQFPPLSFRFSTLHEYFTARAKEMEQEDREAGLQQHEKDEVTQQDAASNASSPHFAPPNASAPAPFPSLPPGTDFFPYACPMQPPSLCPVPIA